MTFLLDILREHAISVLVSGSLLSLGWLLGTWRSQRQWVTRDFLDRLNVSLNIIKDGKLLIRTLQEKPCEEVFLNESTRRQVIAAARKTTEKDCILPLPLKDYWYFLNPVLNEISEAFAEGFLRQEAGKATPESYLLCLTCEEAPTLRQRKIRAMLIKESLLLHLPSEQPAMERPHHETRWHTLQWMAQEYQREPQRFLQMELCV